MTMTYKCSSLVHFYTIVSVITFLFYSLCSCCGTLFVQCKYQSPVFFLSLGLLLKVLTYVILNSDNISGSRVIEKIHISSRDVQVQSSREAE